MTKASEHKENALVRYFRETRAEMGKVHWPTRQETVRLTQIVLIVTVGMAIFLWLMDVLFDWWLGGILESDPWRIGLAIAAFAISVVAAVLLGRRQE